MNQDSKNVFNDWYDLWMQQSKAFYESAEKNLGDLFNAEKLAHPEEHLKQINAWLDELKKQWQTVHLTEEQKTFAKQWENMSAIFNQASDLMLKQWLQASQDKNPIKNIKELYQLWLDSCQQVYKQAMQNKNMQDMYAEYMKAAMNFWKGYMPK